jgi:prepilin-type N-terminal cleavage/methylation domain-containing protein
MARKAETGLLRTYVPTIPTSELESGFTLLEMLVVAAIVALFTVFALPSITSYFRVSLNSATREMATTIKEAYNSTVITGKIHRIVYDIKNAQYWVEVGPATVTLDTKESKEREEHRNRFRKSEPKTDNTFALARLVTRSKVNLPAGVTFEDITSEQSTDPITTGTTYTHFFPQGFTEQTLIHLQDESHHHITLAISPLVGRTDMFERYVDRKEAFGKE